jgi:hypothetical protein
MWPCDRSQVFDEVATLNRQLVFDRLDRLVTLGIATEGRSHPLIRRKRAKELLKPPRLVFSPYACPARRRHVRNGLLRAGHRHNWDIGASLRRLLVD